LVLDDVQMSIEGVTRRQKRRRGGVPYGPFFLSKVGYGESRKSGVWRKKAFTLNF